MNFFRYSKIVFLQIINIQFIISWKYTFEYSIHLFYPNTSSFLKIFLGMQISTYIHTYIHIHIFINKSPRPLWNFNILKLKKSTVTSNFWETDSIFLTNLYMTMFSINFKSNRQAVRILHDLFCFWLLFGYGGWGFKIRIKLSQ